MTGVKINPQMLLQATTDSVFTATSPPTGEFNVDLIQQSADQSVGISLCGGADPVTGPSAVYIEKLSPDGLAASDGRLHAGENCSCSPVASTRVQSWGDEAPKEVGVRRGGVFPSPPETPLLHRRGVWE